MWDLRYASVGPINFHSPDPSNPYDQLENGYLAMPGTYKVSLSKFEDGIITEIVPAVSFNTKLLNADLIAQSEKKTTHRILQKNKWAKKSSWRSW